MLASARTMAAKLRGFADGTFVAFAGPICGDAAALAIAAADHVEAGAQCPRERRDERSRRGQQHPTLDDVDERHAADVECPRQSG